MELKLLVCLFPQAWCASLYLSRTQACLVSALNTTGYLSVSVISAQITGAVSFLKAETRVRKETCASRLLHEDGKPAESKVSKKLV